MFYTRCAELYAKAGASHRHGDAPQCTLRTGHHLKWRSGSYKQKGVRDAPIIGLNLRVQEPWDLDNVAPDFFPMPASVVFAQYIGVGQGNALAPSTVEVWRGDWKKDYTGISRKSEALHHDDGRFRSPYAELTRNGVKIEDRRLFFVETIPHTAMLPTANTTNVRARLGTQDKITYEGQLNTLEGVVSNDHLFDVYLGECIAPYVALDPLKAAMPVHRPTMTMPLIHEGCEAGKHDACRLDLESLHQACRRRWANATEMYREAHQQQSNQGPVQTDLNYQNISSPASWSTCRAQLRDDGTVRVAYTQSGQPTAAIIRDNHAIMDRKLYQTVCQSDGEASYLTDDPQQR